MADAELSKFLAFLLRHDPGSIGLSIDESGWANVDELLEKSAASGRTISREAITRVLATGTKQRFAFSADGSHIRAEHGHSFPVELSLDPQSPPPTLFHGTAERFLESISAHGLLKRSRQYVHLTLDTDDAMVVAARHGKPVLLRIDAARMHADGRVFFCTKSNIWLTDHVPAEYLSRA